MASEILRSATNKGYSVTGLGRLEESWVNSGMDWQVFFGTSGVHFNRWWFRLCRQTYRIYWAINVRGTACTEQ